MWMVKADFPLTCVEDSGLGSRVILWLAFFVVQEEDEENEMETQGQARANGIT